MTTAWEEIAGPGPVLFTCEHASARLPEPWKWGEDAWLAPLHWAYDLGARELVQELAAQTACPAVLATFTRLLVDANRSESDVDLFRSTAEGRSIHLNQTIERDVRLETFYRPYHQAVDRLLANPGVQWVFSVHSFTPVYDGQVREVEVGVLFDAEDDTAAELALALFDRGQPCWLNEPYSGKEGLIFSASSHAARHRIRALELEVRQDLACDPAWRATFVERLVNALREVGLLPGAGDL